jgi:hypothetical protein
LNIFYRLGTSFTYAFHQTAGSETPASDKYQLLNSVIAGVGGGLGAYGHTPAATNAVKGTNVGSITAAYSNPSASPYENWWIVTSN